MNNIFFLNVREKNLMSTKSKHSLVCNSKITSMLHRAHSFHRPVTGTRVVSYTTAPTVMPQPTSLKI